MINSDKGKIDSATLAKHAKRVGQKGLPPVHRWNPEFCGDIDIRIARNGDWFYLGSRFTRPAMVKLFSSILRKDEDDYYLVTPVEKVRITVDDAPFVITQLQSIDRDGEVALRLQTNTDEQFFLDRDHPLRVEIDSETGEPSPYVRVRDRLDALLSRNVYYQLAEMAQPCEINGRTFMVVGSAGSRFILAELAPEDQF